MGLKYKIVWVSLYTGAVMETWNNQKPASTQSGSDVFHTWVPVTVIKNE